MGFAPMERVTAAVLQSAANEKLLGRAAGILPLGNEDLGDDFEGAFAGICLCKHVGDVLVNLGQAQQSELARMDSAIGGVAH
jgi:5'-hydroxyaverantin dehydrogenase